MNPRAGMITQPSVFKTVSISQTLTHLYFTEVPGFEPRQVDLETTMLPLHHTPILAEPTRIELVLSD